jgi:mRNA-degrading endonuclease toxin of MazEF toxin-antitoxin module
MTAADDPAATLFQPHPSDPACVFIDVTTPEGRARGLHQNGVVSCLHLVTMNADRLGSPIGTLPPTLLQRVNDALKVALELP